MRTCDCCGAGLPNVYWYGDVRSCREVALCMSCDHFKTEGGTQRVEELILSRRSAAKETQPLAIPCDDCDAMSRHVKYRVGYDACLCPTCFKERLQKLLLRDGPTQKCIDNCGRIADHDDKRCHDCYWAYQTRCPHPPDAYDTLKCICTDCGIDGKRIIPNAPLDGIQEKILPLVPDDCIDAEYDEYDGHGMEQHIEEQLIETLNGLADAVTTVRAIRTGTRHCGSAAYYANGVRLTDFRREAPALLAELTREVAKL